MSVIRTTSIRKYLWFKERTDKVFHELTIKYWLCTETTRKQLQILRLIGCAGFRVRKYHR